MSRFFCRSLNLLHPFISNLLSHEQKLKAKKTDNKALTVCDMCHFQWLLWLLFVLNDIGGKDEDVISHKHNDDDDKNSESVIKNNNKWLFVKKKEN